MRTRSDPDVLAEGCDRCATAIRDYDDQRVTARRTASIISEARGCHATAEEASTRRRRAEELPARLQPVVCLQADRAGRVQSTRRLPQRARHDATPAVSLQTPPQH